MQMRNAEQMQIRERAGKSAFCLCVNSHTDPGTAVKFFGTADIARLFVAIICSELNSLQACVLVCAPIGAR